MQKRNTKVFFSVSIKMQVLREFSRHRITDLRCAAVSSSVFLDFILLLKLQIQGEIRESN